MDGSDIFAGQPADAELLAALYDLEHDSVTEDLDFYRELAGRARGDVLDLGCGSGRLFRSLLPAAPRRLLGVDGSAALLRRARQRVSDDPVLAAAATEGRLTLLEGDVRRLRSLGLGRFSLIVVAGVLPHLGGPAGIRRLLRGARARLTAAGRLALDDLGPALLPGRNLAWSVDWRRSSGGRRVVRRSQLLRRREAGGLRVAYTTISEVAEPDGTIARFPASHLLWYPSPATLAELVADTGLAVEQRYGSHDLEPFGANSERRIYLVRRQELERG